MRLDGTHLKIEHIESVTKLFQNTVPSSWRLSRRPRLSEPLLTPGPVSAAIGPGGGSDRARTRPGGGLAGHHVTES